MLIAADIYINKLAGLRARNGLSDIQGTDLPNGLQFPNVVAALLLRKDYIVKN